MLCKKVLSDGSSRIELPTYCWIPDHKRSRDWVLAMLRHPPQDLEIIQ